MERIDVEQPLVGIVEDPTNSPCWQEAKAFLEPAAKLGGVPLLEEHELLWIVALGGKLVAAATTRLTEGIAEVVLVGGRDHESWLRALDTEIGRWAKDEGCTALRAYGRRGWEKVLGWEITGREGKFSGYERRLNV